MTKTNITIEYVWIDGQESQSLRSKTRILHVDLRRYSNLESYIGETPRLVSFTDLEKIPIWDFDGSFTNQKCGDEPKCILRPIKLYKESDNYIALCEVYNMDDKPVSSNYRWKLKSKKLSKTELNVKQEFIIWNDIRTAQNDFYCGVANYGKYIIDEYLKSCSELKILIDEIYSTEYRGKWIYQLSSDDALSISDDLWISRFMLYNTCNKNREIGLFDPNKISVYSIPLKLHIKFKDKLFVFNGQDDPYKMFCDLM